MKSDFSVFPSFSFFKIRIYESLILWFLWLLFLYSLLGLSIFPAGCSVNTQSVSYMQNILPLLQPDRIETSYTTSSALLESEVVYYVLITKIPTFTVANSCSVNGAKWGGWNGNSYKIKPFSQSKNKLHWFNGPYESQKKY